MDDVLEYSDGGKTVIDVKDKSVKTIVIPKGVTFFLILFCSFVIYKYLCIIIKSIWYEK